MKLGIMQPYFFPYFGHFQLIARADRWVVFDIVKYNRKSWVNRNRILRPDTGWQYISVPTSKAGDQSIHDVAICDKSEVLTKILGQLDHYRRRAPHFERVVELLRRAFDATKTDRLAELNRQGLSIVCAYLGIPFQADVCSDFASELPPVSHAGQWALEICKKLGANAYVNPESGRDIFRPEEWRAAGIELEFLTPAEFRYDCPPYAFESGLSIIDVLMWNEPEKVAHAIREANEIPGMK